MISRLAASLVLLLAMPVTPAYRAEIAKYRADRLAELTAPTGWLAVQGLYWLHEGPNSAGSSADAAVRLPAAAPARIGRFNLDHGTVTFVPEPGSKITTAGQPLTGPFTFEPKQGEHSSIAVAGLTLFVITRTDKVGIRMLDPAADARAHFAGLHYFPLDPAYRVRARYTAYDKTRQVGVPNVLGQIVQMESPGVVEFTLAGKPYRLQPVYETAKHENLFFIFKDLTSASETYHAGRFLHAPLPVNGIVDLDFNRAYNPPCAFTAFATCPLPIKENRLATRVAAGELTPH